MMNRISRVCCIGATGAATGSDERTGLAEFIEMSWRLFAVSGLILASLLFSSQLALAQFTQEGPKLVGTGAVGNAEQGTSVALSADGNTAIVGGPQDDIANMGFNGAAWVFTRSNGVWTQQGAKLVGTKLGRRSGVGRRRVPGRTLVAMLKNRIPARLQVPQLVGGRSASRNALLSTLARLVPRIGCKDCARHQSSKRR